jgi:hypothetical protein
MQTNALKGHCAPVSLFKLLFARHTPVDDPLMTHVTTRDLCAAGSDDLRGGVIQPALVVDHCSAKPVKTRAVS